MKLNPFMQQLVSLLKSVALVGVIFMFLRFTGLMTDLSYYSQSAVMATGVLDADAEMIRDKDAFEYDFTIKNLKGERTAFSQYKGKVIFLNLWATWCGPCRAEMPTIEKLYQASDTSKIAFVILSIDRDRDKAKIDSYVSSNNYTFPVFQPSGSLPEVLQVPSIPTTFIIGKDGTIASREVGTTNFNTPRFKKFLDKLVNE